MRQRFPALLWEVDADRALSVSRVGAALVWLLFMVFPLIAAAGRHAPVLRHAFALVGAGAFVVTYISLVFAWRSRGRRQLTSLLWWTLLALAAALTLLDQASWGFLFTYCAAFGAILAPPSAGFATVLGCTVLAGVLPALADGKSGSVLGFVSTTAGVGMLMLLLRDLRQRNDELTTARAELARMAVAAERERFARDLHDLLGHTLSVITLKAELAGRLLPGRPDAAAREVADLEGVARAALSEVRETVSGYRQPTLDRELAGAKMALAAARIDATVECAVGSLDPAAEAVLAWTVREGATNVIRHSRAQHCRIAVACVDGMARVEIADDGCGAAAASGGNGLAGLRERALAARGVLEAGARPDRGFRLVVWVPVAAQAAPDVAAAPVPGRGAA